MASKVTPLYAKTRILLNLWALDETPAAKSHFVPGGEAYKAALAELIKDDSLAETPKTKKTKVYSLTASGQDKLAKNLADEAFAFSSNIGPKTTNALLSWIRIIRATGSQNEQMNQAAAQTHADSQPSTNGKASQIDSYDEFTQTALKTYDQLNQDYNLDDLVPIYRIRREIGDRLPRQKFNEWLLEVQANDLVQLMGSNLSNVTADQMEDSLTIPGAGARFFVKRLS